MVVPHRRQKDYQVVLDLVFIRYFRARPQSREHGRRVRCLGKRYFLVIELARSWVIY